MSRGIAIPCFCTGFSRVKTMSFTPPTTSTSSLEITVHPCICICGVISAESCLSKCCRKSSSYCKWRSSAKRRGRLLTKILGRSRRWGHDMIHWSGWKILTGNHGFPHQIGGSRNLSLKAIPCSKPVLVRLKFLTQPFLWCWYFTT